MAAPAVISPRRSDTLTVEATLASGTAWVEVAKYRIVPPRRLLIHNVDVQCAGEIQFQLIDATKEATTDLNANARKAKFFPLRFPTPITILQEHEFVVNGMQGYGYDVQVRMKIEVEWVG